MFSTTQPKPRRIRWAAALTAAAGLTISGALVAPQAFGGSTAAPTGSDVSQSSSVADTPTGVGSAEADAEVTYQRGIVLAGTGSSDRRQVFVEIYANDVYGGQVTVIVEPPGGPRLAATVDVAVDDLLDGEFSIDAELDRMTRGGPVPTRDDITVAGSWAHSGAPTPIDESYEDAGYFYHVTGTNTPVAADLVVTIGGTDVPVQLHDAFAFDLAITATPL